MSDEVFEFDGFRVEVASRRLLKENAPLHISSRAFDLLVELINRNGEIISQDDLMNAVWHDQAVEPNNLSQAVKKIRRALGDSGKKQKYLITVPRQGFKFVLPENNGHQNFSADVVQENNLAPENKHEKSVVENPPLPDSTKKNHRIYLTVVGLLVVIAVSTAFYFLRQSQKKSALGIKTIAVLPFKSIGQDPRNESLKIGMADALISRLSRIDEINVLPTSLVNRFNNAEQNAIEAGKELKVDAVLDGRIQEESGQMRVSLQLIRIADGKIIWAQEFNRNAADIFDLQMNMAREIAENLSLELSDDEKRALMKRYTNNTEAYRLYLEGTYLFNQRTAASRTLASANFQKAVELDPKFALCYAALARMYVEPQSDMSPKQAYKKMEVLARQAVEIDNTLGEGYAALGFAVWRGEWNWREGENYFQRALALNPDWQRTYNGYALLLIGEGRFDEASTLISRSPEEKNSANNGLGDYWTKLVIYIYSRQTDKAIAEAEKISRLYPNETGIMGILSFAYRYKGDYQKAIQIAEKHISMEEVTQPGALMSLGLAYAANGQTEKAREIEKKLEAFPDNTPNIFGTRAFIYTALGEKEKALGSLEKAFELGEYHLYLLKVNPDFDSLRDEPRFIEILKNVNLAS